MAKISTEPLNGKEYKAFIELNNIVKKYSQLYTFDEMGYLYLSSLDEFYEKCGVINKEFFKKVSNYQNLVIQPYLLFEATKGLSSTHVTVKKTLDELQVMMSFDEKEKEDYYINHLLKIKGDTIEDKKMTLFKEMYKYFPAYFKKIPDLMFEDFNPAVIDELSNGHLVQINFGMYGIWITKELFPSINKAENVGIAYLGKITDDKHYAILKEQLPQITFYTLIAFQPISQYTAD